VSRREDLRDTLKPGELTVCRLRAPIDLLERRVRARETGVLRGQWVARVAVLKRLSVSGRIGWFIPRFTTVSITPGVRTPLLTVN
jgi:hypothetical protein